LFQFDAFSWSLFGIALLLILLMLAMRNRFFYQVECHNIET
jgi:hypothetical protein